MSAAAPCTISLHGRGLRPKSIEHRMGQVLAALGRAGALRGAFLMGVGVSARVRGLAHPPGDPMPAPSDPRPSALVGVATESVGLDRHHPAAAADPDAPESRPLHRRTNVGRGGDAEGCQWGLVHLHPAVNESSSVARASRVGMAALCTQTCCFPPTSSGGRMLLPGCTSGCSGEGGGGGGDSGAVHMLEAALVERLVLRRALVIRLVRGAPEEAVDEVHGAPA
eukprot:CAMPEP_0206055460 /NCGR_PEP_ID=MMETSP1466-20131121/40173_1 /ASSEMBLY_ACC=CAM_ASM_001126 /TAXON_ID=44452 /ORGANISM="Pavlova gyrans, Strain CCMP608" /LENGTH=223 /DNA_ID=CAMNT_0053430685 /DNA_START=159 /DNA_END=826 /DNA_ORIENTATION=-